MRSTRIDRWASRCFNGAAVSRPRKCNVMRRRHASWQCFNGAAVCRARKCTLSVPAPLPRVELQWGRALSSAEIVGSTVASSRMKLLQWGRALRARKCGPRRDSPRLHGFNGAALFDRGNAQAHVAMREVMLQWGRALRSRKSAACRIYDRSSTCFNGAAVSERGNVQLTPARRRRATVLQWGRAFDRGNDRDSVQCQSAQPASMGPRSSIAEMRRSLVPVRLQRRFNGAALSERGNMRQSAPMMPRYAWLQWGRAL